MEVQNTRVSLIGFSCLMQTIQQTPFQIGIKVLVFCSRYHIVMINRNLFLIPAFFCLYISQNAIVKDFVSPCRKTGCECDPAVVAVDHHKRILHNLLGILFVPYSTAREFAKSF